MFTTKLSMFYCSGADYSGRIALVAGWGRTAEQSKPSNVLRKVAVPVWSKKECISSGYGERKISENMFCAGYPDGEKDACQVIKQNKINNFWFKDNLNYNLRILAHSCDHQIHKY